VRDADEAHRRVRYINTDLDVVSRRRLTPLIVAFEASSLVRVNEYRRGPLFCAGFEINGQRASAEKCVVAMLDVIDRLRGDARAIWKSCTSRVVDIGYDAATGRGRFHDALSARTIERLAQHRIGVAISVYPA
jgi:hypothetical protein